MNDKQINPYESPSDVPDPADIEADRIVTIDRPQLSFKQLAVTLVAITGFFILGYFAFHQCRNREWFGSCVTACASLMCIPFVDHTFPIRERFWASLIVPFAIAGLAGSVFLYFQMFQFSWFYAIFNNEGTGPMGLVFSVILGLAIGACIGFQVISIFVTFRNIDEIR